MRTRLAVFAAALFIPSLVMGCPKPLATYKATLSACSIQSPPPYRSVTFSTNPLCLPVDAGPEGCQLQLDDHVDIASAEYFVEHTLSVILVQRDRIAELEAQLEAERQLRQLPRVFITKYPELPTVNAPLDEGLLVTMVNKILTINTIFDAAASIMWDLVCIVLCFFLIVLFGFASRNLLFVAWRLND